MTSAADPKFLQGPPRYPRILVEAIEHYCAKRGIALDIRADGWLLVLDHPARRHLIFGYDLGLNSAVAHRIASDKAATAEVLMLAGLPAVPHRFFMAPKLGGRQEPHWPAMLELLETCPDGLVVKPNEGTSGRLVMLVSSRTELEHAVSTIFASNTNVAISPFLEIDEEARVVLLDDDPLAVYRKDRPVARGDGEHRLRELVTATLPPPRHADVLRRFDASALDAIVPAGEIHLLDWRHNLDLGATAVLLDDGAARDACVRLAAAAARAIGIRFASIDVVRADGQWRVLEINSGVVMEALGRTYPDLVQAVYGAALDKMFGAASTS
jgi:glutathione synthase/RimK-type ligase-like ATP-grasp enzyme